MRIKWTITNVIDNHDVGAVGATRRHHSDLLVQRSAAKTLGDTLGNVAAS
jgi:hypothetical protein